ncbi:hypothetical protein V8B55DRAFT_1033121 [Mucor lusitanicus]
MRRPRRVPICTICPFFYHTTNLFSIYLPLLYDVLILYFFSLSRYPGNVSPVLPSLCLFCFVPPFFASGWWFLFTLHLFSFIDIWACSYRTLIISLGGILGEVFFNCCVCACVRVG